MTSSVASVDRQVCTFVVSDLLLGLPLTDVSEIVLGADVSPVPLAPEGVVGLFNLRGRIVTVVDARARLGLPPLDPDQGPGHHVIVTVQGDLASLVVDRTSDVVTVAERTAEAVPETVPSHIRRLVTASYQRPEGLLLLLDPTRVLTTT
jgi:purine-binding chemotaxis protein CheW